jgi:hypothetical protein
MPIRSPRYKLTRAMVDGAPAEPGVYALWEDEELIYLGRASAAATIRARLQEHLVRRICPCAENATHYSWELALRPATRELELLQELLARYGRLPRCNEDAA